MKIFWIASLIFVFIRAESLHPPKIKVFLRPSVHILESEIQRRETINGRGVEKSLKLNNSGCNKWGIGWGKTIIDTYLTPLFILQKKILRCIKFQQPTAPSAPLFHSLMIVKLEDMLHLNVLTFVYKAINKLSPVYFHNYFTPDSSVHRFGTRQATRGDLYISLKRTTLYGLKTVQYFGSKLWNTLPLFIRVASSITIFRTRLKAYFIDSYA